MKEEVKEEWKINRDPYYAELYQLYGKSFIDEAGYFPDTSTIDENIENSLNILCTPLFHVTTQLASAKNPCVLLNTGSFCPIHDGHIHMMEQAKKAAELKGYNVVAGYFSPGHDEYIFSKVKSKALPIHERLRLINESAMETGWLSADPWEGLFCKVAVNFTDVVYRLEKYIEKHTGKKIPVFFVCGSDNARFALTFFNKGHCIVVNRPGYEDRFLKYKEKCIEQKDRIIFTEGYNDNSSTRMREFHIIKKVASHVVIRTTGNTEESKVNQILKEYFNDIRIENIALQQKIFNDIKFPLINIDPLMSSRFNLEISRCYDLFGIEKTGFNNRPGSLTLKEQIKNIPSGEYVLFDDDIHSGDTMRFARKMLEEAGVKIHGHLSFTIAKDEDTEILDSRDFIIDGKNNGLLIRLPDGTCCRAPYLYPFVCPYSRGSVHQPLIFSIKLWEWNKLYFREQKKKLNELDNKQLFLFSGFFKNDDMADICAYYENYLKELLKFSRELQ